jgi:glycerophosphoryl diester phosphodiesterase
MGSPGSRQHVSIHVSMGVALTLWTALILACSQARLPVYPQPPGHDFLIIGHRGAPQQACENTLESFDTALQLGANALELDLSLTRDQQVVVWHDWRPSLTSVLRPTGRCRLRHPLLPQPLHEVPLDEAVRDYGYERDGHPVPLLTFPAFVHRVGPDVRVRFVFLDLKIPAERPDLVAPLFQQAVQSLQHAHVLAKAVFLTPYAPIFAQLRHEAQRWQQTTQTPVHIAFDTEGPELLQVRAWPSAVERNQRAGTRFALWGQPIATVQSWREFVVEELRRRDAVNARRPPRARLRFIVWTVNDGSDLCALVGAGVDGIMTDDPGRLHAIVQHWGQPGYCPERRSPPTSLAGGG